MLANPTLTDSADLYAFVETIVVRREKKEARAFVDRREIRLPERVREIVRTVETKARSMFAGFRPKAAPEVDPASRQESTSRPDQDVAIRRYARAAVDIAGMEKKRLPVLPHQRTALARAGEALDQVRPHGARDLAAAIERNPQLARDAASGDMRGAVRGMAEEARVRADPSLRAERFMERWRALEAQGGGGNDRAVRAGMIDGLRHDPALRAELVRRAPELGLDRGRETPEKVLERQIEMQRTGVRGELALLRRAVERLAAERADDSHAPDYSETLGVIANNITATAQRVDALVKSPALSLTPEEMNRQIAATRQTIEEVTTKLGRQLESHVVADEQRRRLWRVGLAGLSAGMAVWAIIAGPIARVLPASWLLPERIAARSLRMPMWEGGQRLMKAGDPQAFAGVLAGNRLATANRDALTACRRQAAKAGKAVRCAIEVEREERDGR